MQGPSTARPEQDRDDSADRVNTARSVAVGGGGEITGTEYLQVTSDRT